MSGVDETYKWSNDKTKQLIKLRIGNDNMFNKKRNAAKEAWEFIIKELGLEGKILAKQASKKWENLKKKYKELRRTPTGSRTDQGEETPASWPFYMAMHEALGSRPSISPPVLIASCMGNPPSESPSTSSTPSTLHSTSSPTSPEIGLPPPAKKRKGAGDEVMDYLKEESEREEERHQRHLEQSEKFLKLFEKMVEKM